MRGQKGKPWKQGRNQERKKVINKVITKVIKKAIKIVVKEVKEVKAVGKKQGREVVK
jgi:hypothetical protein